jgi:hypothetical protein
MFTRAHHWSLPCARLIQSTSFHVIKIHLNIIGENLTGDIRAVDMHTVKALVSGTVAPIVLNLVISWRIVVSLRPRPPYPQGKSK